YIPFAQSKRKRSQEIAMQTVARLGGVAQFANGGATGSGGSGSEPALIGITPAQLERAFDRALEGKRFKMDADGRSLALKTRGA
ncbi:MAG: hypothetical protein JWP56_1807, partial [Aeromicrobium sp.]|nr:hypothetical protein [Aeromicrobium sp.]